MDSSAGNQTPKRPPLSAAKKRMVTSPCTPRNQGDRFIPSRSGMDIGISSYILKETTSQVTPQKEEYRDKLVESLWQSGKSPAKSKVLAFRQKKPAPPTGVTNFQPEPDTQFQHPRRNMPQTAYRILDAPSIRDDYYLNLMDWNCNNVVAVGLADSVYLWNATTGATKEMMTINGDGDGNDHISSVSWASDGKHVAVGLSNSEVQIWNSSPCRQVRNMDGHSGRVSCLAWNTSILSSGGADAQIVNHDVRIREHVTSRFRGHISDVCGLKWSPSGRMLASGGNDNLCQLWDVSGSRRDQSLHRLTAHRAAVKALAWCPFQSSLIASGGGTADGSIKFWNATTGACLNSLDTGSQVTGLLWSTKDREILSSHGFSRYQLSLWRYPALSKLADLQGHSARILHVTPSPDGSTVASIAADETIRLWKVFQSPPGKRSRMDESGKPGKMRTIDIR